MQADELDPAAAAAVERQERFPIPHNRLGLKFLRLVSRPAMWYQNRDVPEVGASRDLTIPGPDGDRDARLYLPAGDRPVPTVVFFHGGGYVLGSIATHEWLCRHLARESGCGVLSVNYRLAPEHPFPAAVEDADAAVRWAAANPETVAGDGSLAVAGDSAGGNLAAVAALLAAERGDADLDYQLLIYPGVGVEDDQESVRTHAGIVIDQADMDFFRESYFGSDLTLRNPLANPIEACDLGDVAPATVVTAGFDPLRDGGMAYAERLDADGVPVRHENYDAMPHGFMTLRGVERTHDAIASVAADLDAALGTD
jgi:acetyl esterase